MKEGWTIRTIGEVALHLCDGSHNPPVGIDFSEYPMLSSKNIFFDSYDYSEPRYLTKEQFDIENKRTNVSDGDILLTIVGTIGRVCCIKEPFQPFTLQRSVAVIKPNKNIIISRYLMYCLCGLNAYFNKEAKGVAQKGIYLKQLSKISIPVPPLQEQERIVAELDLLTEIIDKQKQQLKELDTLAQSIFYDMFGNPVENEKGWELKSLGDISVKIANGYNAKLEEGTYKTEGVMYFRCQNVWRNRFDYSDLVYIDEQTNAIMKSSSLKKNDFVITKIGRLFTENSSLGRVSLYEGEDDKANISGNLCFVRLKEGVCHKFILYILISEHFRDYVRNTTTGGIDKRALNCKQVASYNVILPPLELQKVFSEKVKAIESQKESINRSIAESQKLFDYTMDKYFG